MGDPASGGRLFQPVVGGRHGPAGNGKGPQKRPDGKAAVQEQADYIRLIRNKSGKPTALETAIVRFVPRDSDRPGLSVDLIAAVHVADRSYYDRINREMEQYDAVLYESLLPRVPRCRREGFASPAAPVTTLQLGMKNLLDLEFQLNAIHYNRRNMLHADMSPEQFAKSMRDRGESFLGLFLRLMGYAMARQSNDPAGTSDMELHPGVV